LDRSEDFHQCSPSRLGKDLLTHSLSKELFVEHDEILVDPCHNDKCYQWLLNATSAARFRNDLTRSLNNLVITSSDNRTRAGRLELELG